MIPEIRRRFREYLISIYQRSLIDLFITILMYIMLYIIIKFAINDYYDSEVRARMRAIREKMLQN